MVCLCCYTLAFSRCAEQGLLSSVVCQLLTAVASLLFQSTGSRVLGLRQLWLRGLVAPRHMGSSGTRDHTGIPLVARWILNLWATREVPRKLFFPFKNISGIS